MYKALVDTGLVGAKTVATAAAAAASLPETPQSSIAPPAIEQATEAATVPSTPRTTTPALPAAAYMAPPAPPVPLNIVDSYLDRVYHESHRSPSGTPVSSDMASPALVQMTPDDVNTTYMATPAGLSTGASTDADTVPAELPGLSPGVRRKVLDNMFAAAVKQSPDVVP